MTFVGRTALSVEIRTNVLTLLLIAANARENVPNILFFTPSMIFDSTIGTCLKALRGLGSGGRGNNTHLESYLLFEKGYCRELISLGFNDAVSKSSEIENLVPDI